MNDDQFSTPTPQPPDNVVKMTEKIIADAPESLAELERKKAIVMRAFEITKNHFERDANSILQSAIVSEIPPKDRIGRVLTSHMLFQAAAWIDQAYLNRDPQPAPPTIVPDAAPQGMPLPFVPPSSGTIVRPDGNPA